MARRPLKDPPSQAIKWPGAHRLIPSLYSDSPTVLSELADTEADLQNLIVLDGATNDRILAEHHGSIGISPYELVYGIPNAHIVNAAFTHTSDSGSRFNDSTRGAWYAARAQETCIAEVTYHKARRLNEIVMPGERFGKPPSDISTYDDWLADFEGDFHALEPAAAFPDFLRPEPVPACYASSQSLARTLLNQGSNGILYESVRRAGAKCIACFRPALVYRPRRSDRLEITFTATMAGYSHRIART